MPVLMLSQRNDGGSDLRIAGGADDYLPKPFSPAELVVRVKALLREQSRARQTGRPLLIGDLVVDLDRHESGAANDRIALTRV